ncbi:MAG: SRPBCC family protein [Bacteroidia bacterium]|nr:SRPBCC family protein [Bacteroidia bacterium]NNF30314.1 AraC family transcriptional regulator [Flavobacteriaceae bacterium]MBT8276390.1 SRPBCC family protein [Bacteroidia bacterium]NNJ80989.1 AraC family transcriptional regulator [Flavobacteriaceae bacterium]NNK53541.1 AraC family transcriptional regulator [Flavobacteriaceae bacterium]
MKILKYLLFLLLIIIVAGGIYFGTKDGKFDVAESKEFNAPAEVIYNNVKDYKNWAKWGPWKEEDPSMEFTYAEKTEGEGASYSWTSDVMGDGSMQTIKIIPNKEIDQKIIFNTPIGDSESDIYWKFEPSEEAGKTKVTWGMKGEHSFMEKVFMAFQSEDFDVAVKRMYDKGLANLETEVEESMNAYEITVDGITRHGGGFYLYNTTSSKMTEIGDKMASMMGQLSGFIQENNISMAGMPFTIYNEVDEQNGTVIFSAAIPVTARVITPQGSPVLCSYMAPVDALKTTLKGKYDYLSEGYAKAQNYLKENNLMMDPGRKMFEVYANDPGNVPNPANWITEIYIPVLTPSTPGFNR